MIFFMMPGPFFSTKEATLFKYILEAPCEFILVWRHASPAEFIEAEANIMGTVEELYHIGENFTQGNRSKDKRASA